MLSTIQAALKERLAAASAELFDLALASPVVEIPRDLAHADLASPVAFELARRFKAEKNEKRPPRAIAEALAGWIRDRGVEGIDRVEIAGAGYINVFFDRGAFLKALATRSLEPTDAGAGKTIVEHTSVNPNKATHVGHLRNAVLGDTVVRILRAAGHAVEVQNYIDNTGVQVADIVVGFRHVDPHTLDELKALSGDFDRICWNLYSRVGLFYRDGRLDGPENPEKLKLRADVQHALEEGSGEIVEMAEFVAMKNLEAHLRTLYRLGIVYDAMPRESEVLHSNFWSEVFEMLKSAGAVHYVESGKQAGCWVMKAGEAEAEGTEDDPFTADKILVKSNGVTTYTAKDIAYHFWKLDRIDKDFDYRPFFEYPDGHVAWITAPDGTGLPDHPRFGHGARYINVIDVSQSYLQEFVKRGVAAVAGNDPRVAASTHFNYEKVGLTVAACDELGFELKPEERTKSFIGMSGRLGRGVISDDLLDRLESDALDEIRKRDLGYPEDEQRDIARKIAVGAVRYFLLKYTRNSLIAFDFKEALSFQGETGPYLQNAAVRIGAIFRKASAAGIRTENPTEGLSPETVTGILSAAENAEFWPLVHTASELPDVVERAAASLEPAFVAKYAFELAQTWNKFQQKPENNIIHEKDPARQAVMLEMGRVVRRTLVAALSILGIEVPARM